MTRTPSSPASRPRWLLAGYAGLAGFVALEAVLRSPGESADLEPGRDDRGTTRGIVLAYGLAVDLPVLARWLPGRPLPAPVAPVGLGVELTGLAWRAWSMRTLGRFYSRTLRVVGGPPGATGTGPVETGPYRWVRHPGYLGSLLTWTGFALTSRRAPVVAAVAGLLAAAYVPRVLAEEDLLRRELPGYDAYAARTRRLVPGVW